MRVLWIVVYPLVVFAAISLITQASVFFILPLFVYTFPLGILVGLGMPTSLLKSNDPLLGVVFIASIALFFLLYVWFVYMVKRLGSRTLRALSIILVASLILGTRGCVLMISEIRF